MSGYAVREGRYFIEIDYAQRSKRRQNTCGDSFLSRKIREENRSIAILSDGLGSGIKASVLSTLTAVMVSRFVSSFRDVQKTAEIIMKTLPVCRQRKISYATFTIVDIDGDGNAGIVEYDNPPVLIIRNLAALQVETSAIEGRVGTKRRYTLHYSRFPLDYEDRVVLFSDGVVQAGMGSVRYPLGWGWDNAVAWAVKCAHEAPGISATELSESVVKKALEIDGGCARDDISCAVMYYRRPRELMIVSGPPLDKHNDAVIAGLVAVHAGSKVVCGGTTARIISRELNRPVHFDYSTYDATIPPASTMAGIDLVTEGIITLQRAADILRAGRTTEQGPPSPAQALVGIMLRNDIVRFIAGTRINEAYQDPSLPEEIGLRRTIINELRRLLESDYGKEVVVQYV